MLIGRRDEELGLPIELRDRFIKQDREVLDENKCITVHSEEITLGESSSKWFKTLKIPVQNPKDNNRLMVLGIATDITVNEQLRNQLSKFNAELQLKVLEEVNKRYKQEERYRELFENINDAIILVRFDDISEGLIIVELNKSCSVMFGKSREEMLRTPIDSLLVPPERDIVLSKLLDSMDEGVNTRLITKLSLEEREIDVELKIHRYINANQLNFIITIIDVSENQKLKNEKKEQKRLIEMIFKNAHSGICFLDENYNFVRVNKGFAHMLGYKSRELVGIPFTECLEDGFREEFVSGHKNSFLSGEKMQIEYKLKKKDGSFLSSFGSSVMIKSEQGEKYRLIIIEDISKLKELEEKQKEQERMMAQQAKMAEMGDMVGAIAHQWRQPLNTINAALIKLRMAFELDMGTKEGIIETAKFVEDQTLKMSGTINDFLNYFKPSKEAEYFTLDSCLANIFKMVGAQLDSRGIKTTVDVGDKTVIFGYKNELEHVLLNVILNARDAYSEQNLNEKIIRIVARSDEKIVSIVIDDNAGGIPETIIKKIFNPYFTTKETNKGTGIGLYMSKTIIEKSFNGKLEAKNIENGARFIITLPRRSENGH